MVNKQQGNFNYDCLIDVTNIPDLLSVKLHEDYYQIGAAVKLTDIISDDFINANFKVLVDAARSVASPLIRNQATIGGNVLCENRCIFYNQSEWWREAAGFCLKCGGKTCLATGGKKVCLSKFVSDVAAALISLNAKVVLVTNGSEKSLPLEEIYSGEGINPKKFKNDTILKSILLPLNMNFNSVYKKLRQRKTLEFTSLTMAASLDKGNTIKIAISGVAPAPVVVKIKKGESFDSVYNEINKKSKIIDNDFFDRHYRKTMLKTYLSECLKELGSHYK